jgi:hypothetical protein
MYSPTRVLPSTFTAGAAGALAYTGGPLTLMLLAALALMVIGVLALRSSRVVAR